MISPRYRACLLLAMAMAMAMAVLGGCATAPRREAPPAVDPAQAQAWQQARQERLQAIPDWSMQGRIALSAGDRGGNGRLEWQQQGPAYQVSLAAPVTRQGWSLAGGPGGARLDGLAGGSRTGEDAATLLLEATGWPIPVAQMADWVRGVAAAEDAVEFGADGRLRRLVAAGWTVDYQEWQAAAGPWPEMPRRLQAVREGARVRLVVDGWEAGR